MGTWMNAVLLTGLVALVLIGLQILHLLRSISQTLIEVRESLPDRIFRNDTESDFASMRTFWSELRFTTNRIARIYDKYVLNKT